MFKLLKINNTEIPDPEGDFTISKIDKFNKYEGEDGSITIEAIRTGMVDVKVTYIGQTVDNLMVIANALKLVSDVEIFDPAINNLRTIVARVSNITMGKNYHKNNVSMWSLSFNISEI